MAKWDLSHLEKINRRLKMAMWTLFYMNCLLFCILIYIIIWKAVFG